MATLVTRIGDLATRIATENKALRTLLNGNLSDLTSLSTTAKTNLVAADVPLSFHPAATRVLGLVTPRSVG